MATEAPAAKPKGKKMMIIVIVLVLVLVIVGGLGAFLLMKRGHAEDEGEGGAGAAATAKAVPKGPPTFLPFDNMVVNLADPGGNRFVQIGLTLQVDDLTTSDQIKAFMPSLRSAFLLILSQRTTDELLQVQGKEQLAADITAEVSRQLGYDKARHNPIQAVLFSSFIIQ